MLAIRKFVVSLDELCLEADQPITPPVRKVVAAAVVRNPFAGRYVEDLSSLIEAGDVLGRLLTDRALALLGADARVVSYGKAAIVGLRGELEHAAALLHPRLGKPLRTAIGQGLAVIPSVTKRASAGASVDIPLHCKDDEWSFDHFDAVSLAISDAPADDEIVIALAVADRGRPLARIRKGS
jgi:hypothetical protein